MQKDETDETCMYRRKVQKGKVGLEKKKKVVGDMKGNTQGKIGHRQLI